MSDIQKFKHWCYKVLPLVYDDSLSYYELLCKVVNKLNECINKSNEVNEEIGQLSERVSILAEYVENFVDTPEFYQKVQQALDELAETGFFETLINSSKLRFADNLNLKRLGTEYRDSVQYHYSEIQGMTMEHDTLAYAYYVNVDDAYTSGMIRKFNPNTNETYVSNIVDAAHGQALAVDDDYLYILGYYDSSGVSGDIDHQYITICNKTTLDFIEKRMVDFSGLPVISISNLFYDKYTEKLYIGGTTSADRYRTLRLMEIVRDEEDDDIFKVVETSLILLSKNKDKGYVNTVCDENYYYSLSNGNGCSLSVWNKKTRKLVQNINLKILSNDYMFLGEPEGVCVLDDGEIYFNFLAVITRASPQKRSGLCLNSFAKSNVFTNEIIIDHRGNEIQTCPLHYLYATYDTDDLVTYYSNSGDNQNKPLQTIYQALMFRNAYNNTVITCDGAINSVDEWIVVQGKHNVRFEFSGDTDIATNFLFNESDNITVEITGTHKNTGEFILRQSSVDTNLEVHNASLTASELTCRALKDIDRIDSTSKVFVLGGAITTSELKSTHDYEKILPYTARIYHSSTTLTKTADNVLKADVPIDSFTGTRWCCFKMTVGGKTFQSTPFIVFKSFTQYITLIGDVGTSSVVLDTSTARARFEADGTLQISYYDTDVITGNFTGLSLYIM